MPKDALAAMTNMWLTQDGLPTPRPSLIRYGEQPLGTVLGIDTFNKDVSGAPERWEISMQVISGVGKIHVRKDGDTWDEVGGTYDDEAPVTFAQTGKRVYIGNGVDAMSYYDIATDAIVTYTALTTPSAPNAVKTGLAGTNYTFYYRITATNESGETNASVADDITTDKLRNDWTPGSDYVSLSWSAVTDAVAYNVYVGTSAGNEQLLASGINATTFKDDGSSVTNPFKVAPAGNSTEGPKLKYLYANASRVWGCGDPENPWYVWYSGTDTNAGNFSVHYGGGYVAIDYGGDTVPVCVRSFRDGKGDAVITVLSQGAAGSGKLSHITFNERTYGETVIIYPEVYEANGMAGTTSPLAVVEAANSIWYPTGMDFKTTGTKANIVNILTTDSISQVIEEDIKGLNLAHLDKAVGLEYRNIIYWAVPFASSENSEIWLLDLSRRNAWILRWTVPAKFMWLYEDNDGRTHHCVLVDNVIMEFSDSVKTQDDGTAFATRLATGNMTYDEAGVGMAAVQQQRFKILYPRGNIRFHAYGLGESGDVHEMVEQDFNVNISPSGYGQFIYDSSEPIYHYDGNVGHLAESTEGMEVVPLEIDETVNELRDEIITRDAGVDYVLSAIHTQGVLIDNSFYGD